MSLRGFRLKSVRAVQLGALAGLVAMTTVVDGADSSSAPPLPTTTGAQVYVSTVAQLQSAVSNAASGTTITIAPGTYALSGPLYLRRGNVVLRGATERSDDVVLAGKGMTNSTVGYGVWTDAPDVTIANLTIRDVYYHAINFNAGAERPRVYNVHLINAGQQFIKSNPDGSGGGVDGGIVEYSVIEYATTAPTDYTNGVDVHGGANWIVRHNLFRNIATASGLAGPAVLMWNASSNSLVEGNTFINCQREISLGLIDRSPNDHNGGIIRNNFVYRRAGLASDVAIFVGDSPNTQVLHNSILVNGTYSQPIEYRFSGSTGVVVRNNLLDGRIVARDGGSGTVANNLTTANASFFVNAASGDMHLASGAAGAIDKVAAVSNVTTDWDGESRPQGSAADYGADEFTSLAPPPPPQNAAPQVTLNAPTDGQSYTAPAAIALAATASDSDGSVAKVDFFNGAELIGSDSSSPYSFSWTNVAAGTYVLKAIATDNAGGTKESNTRTVTVNTGGGTTPPPAGSLPSPWQTRDIGNPAVAGSASSTNGAFTVNAGGVDIWGSGDQFRFVYQALQGDGEIVARVTSLANTDVWAKAGVMIRENLNAGARNAFVFVTTGNGWSFQRRTSSNGATVSTVVPGGTAPTWVRLVRSGSTFRAYRSSNGTSWTLIGTNTVSMGSSVYVGLAVTSHDPSEATTAGLSNVKVTDN